MKTKEEIIKIKDIYKTAPTHRFAGSVGIAYLFNKFRRSDASVVSRVITTVTKNTQNIKNIIFKIIGISLFTYFWLYSCRY